MRIIWCSILLFFISRLVWAATPPDTIFLNTNSPVKIDLLKQGLVISSETDLEPKQAWQMLSQASGHTVTSNEGFTKKIYWLGFVAKNNSESSLEKIIEIDNPHFDFVHIYKVLDDTIQLLYVTGDAFPFHQRPVLNRNFIIPLQFQPGETISLFIKIDKRNTTVNLPIYLWNAQITPATNTLVIIKMINTLIHLFRTKLSAMHQVFYDFYQIEK